MPCPTSKIVNSQYPAKTATQTAEKPGFITTKSGTGRAKTTLYKIRITMMDKHTAIYVRVSSRRQDHASQLPDLERWAQAHDSAVVWLKDKFTGKSMNRPGMEKLLDDLRAGKVERIVVWRLDRLGRTTKGLCQLFDELNERKVDLVSLRDGFSLASAAGRLQARILASVAEFETELRAERVAAGQAVARRKGKKWGGSKKGWRWKVTDDQLAAIQEMRATGKKIAQIARVTGLSRPTVYRVLGLNRPTIN
jgi:DNA invertase Pin-like site-specific DNA recombinase